MTLLQLKFSGHQNTVMYFVTPPPLFPSIVPVVFTHKYYMKKCFMGDRSFDLHQNSFPQILLRSEKLTWIWSGSSTQTSTKSEEKVRPVSVFPFIDCIRELDRVWHLRLAPISTFTVRTLPYWSQTLSVSSHCSEPVWVQSAVSSLEGHTPTATSVKHFERGGQHAPPTFNCSVWSVY